MAASSKWTCLPLLLVASFISLASAARIFPLDTDDHSSISTTSAPYDDLDWLPVIGVKRKLSVTPSQHDTDDDHSFVSTSMDNTAISYPTPAPRRLFENGEGIMSDEDVRTKSMDDGEVEDKDSLFRHSSDKEIDELMDDLEDVGMDTSDTDGDFDNDRCDILKCGWGWNRGGGSSNGWRSEGSGSYGGGGGGGGAIGSIGGGGGGGGEGNESGGGDGGGGGNEIGGGGGSPGGIGWSWGGSGTGGDGGSTGSGIGWSWGGGGTSGGGHIGRGGVSIGGSIGSGRNSWHWGWDWGGGGSKVAASSDLHPNTGASGMSTDTATAPAPMSN